MHTAALGIVVLLQLQVPPAGPAADAPAAEAPAAEATTETPPLEKKSLLPPKTKKRLLVMDLVDKGAGPEIAGALTQAAQQQALTSHDGETITTTQIQLLLDAQSLQQLVGCDAEACMTQIGALVEADVILGGNVAKVGDDVLITMLTVDPTTGRRITQEQRKTPINKDLYFYTSKQLASFVLTGKAAETRVPVIVIIGGSDTSAPLEATIIVDGKDQGSATTKQLELDPGAHEIVIKKSGYADWRTLIEVKDGTPLSVSATLVGERIYLWPVAIATGGAAVVTGLISLLMIDAAVGEFNGSSVFGFQHSSGRPYTDASKAIDSVELCQREQSIFFLAGRAPAAGEAPFATNGCGVTAMPGVGGWLGITSLALVTVTGALVVTDLILGAE